MNLKSLNAKIAQKNKDEYYSEYALIGDAIKKRRLEINDTQTLVAKGVCSVSYLSKVENNKMVPSHQVVEKLSERLNIDVMSLIPNGLGNKLLIEGMKCFYNEDLEALLNIEEAVLNTQHQQLIEVYKMLVSYMSDQLLDAQSRMLDLELRVMSMDKKTLQVYLVVSSFILYDLESFDKAFQAVNMLGRFEQLLPYVEALKSGMMGAIYAKFDMAVEADLCFKNALNFMRTEDNYKRELDIKLSGYLAVHACSDISIDDYQIENDTVPVPEALKRKYAYVKAEMTKELALTTDYVTYLSKYMDCTRDVWSYKNALAILVNGVESLALKAEIDALFSHPNAKKYAILEFVEYTLFSMKDLDARKQYLKEVAYPLALEHFDVVYMKKYTKELMALANHNSRYKEAMSYLKRLEKHQDQISKVLNVVV